MHIEQLMFGPPPLPAHQSLHDELVNLTMYLRTARLPKKYEESHLPNEGR